ncbi:MAG: GNAT family N-acetyltransferase [Eubacteriales bacterium]
MEYRPIEKSELPKAKALWKQAFGDSDAYIDFNFERNIDLNDSLGVFDRGQLVSMLYMLKKMLACPEKKKNIDVYFIAGVATDKTYQHQGMASAIMKKAHQYLFNKGIPVVYLYPFDHGFYKKLGYHTVSWMKKVTLKKKCVHKADERVSLKDYNKKSLPDPNVLLKIYRAFAETKRSYFIRNAQDFRNIIETLAVDGGRVTVVYQGDEPVGYILYYLNKKKITCTEAVFLDQETAQAAINMMSNNYSGIIFVDDSFELENAETVDYTMMQIVDFEVAKRICGVLTVEDILGTEVMILEQY